MVASDVGRLNLTDTLPTIGVSYGLYLVEKHERELTDPWSIRQAGVYQRYDLTLQRSIWILLQPSAELQVQLRDSACRFQDTNSLETQNLIDIHVLLVSCATERWGSYIEYLEDVCVAMVRIPFFKSRTLDH